MQNKRHLIKTTFVSVIAIITVASVCWTSLERLYPLELKRYQDVSPVVYDANGQMLRAFTVEDGLWRLPVRINEISPDLIEMLICYEDKRFYQHSGTDWLALIRAVHQLALNRRVVSGGSTITMQVARLLEPRPRTVRSKIIEIFRASQIERLFSKNEILEIYATLAPYGGNIEGIKAASYKYFGRNPLHLTFGEAALLVALPQSPSANNPILHPNTARKARRKVLNRMAEYGRITTEVAHESAEDVLPVRLHEMPFRAPLLARRLARGSETEYHSFINQNWQNQIEALALKFSQELPERVSVAVLVVNNESLEAVTYVGSSDFHSTKRFGQVDMVKAIRSPGSTLKPFIYGMGFDAYLIHPGTTINDEPIRFGDYTPENFNKNFNGPVSIEEALLKSLNIPAVSVLNGLGAQKFIGELRKTSIDLKMPSRERAGLPVALGGLGTNLESLVSLYASIARGGISGDVVYHKMQIPTEEKRFLTKKSTGYLKAILKGSKRPEGSISHKNTNQFHKIGFKTGTSYGYRDAWSIGFTNNYTIGIWVGGPDGTPHYNFTGADSAQLLFQVSDIINEEIGEQPLKVTAIDVVPTLLKEFSNRGVYGDQHARLAVRIYFPPDGAVMHVGRGDTNLNPVMLSAVTGRKPYLWLVNGQYIGDSNVKGDFSWRPDSGGAYEITVIDANGQHDTIDVWIKNMEDKVALSR